eukprot:Gb_41377 [translate_table: standard]
MELPSTTVGCTAALGVLFAFLLFLQTIGADDVYIVYMGRKRFEEPHLNTELHYNILKSVLGRHDVTEKAMIYSYRHSFSGFAAKLNATHVAALSTMEGIVSVFKSTAAKLHTTHSWDFMGLSLDATQALLPNSKYGEEVIIGILDSGIWPESQSFRDASMPPLPSRWKGVCQKGEKFNSSNCNKKMIGARWYVKGYEEATGSPLNTTKTPEFRSARDYNGHGTHTASTAGGAIVNGTSFFGFANGVARGGAPGARIAMYKVCWDSGICTEADILAAFDDALNDGVDVISISLGSTPPLQDYFASSSGIGSFHAMEKGVTVVFSAGNDGPYPASVANTEPWGISVAASTIDRSFPTNLVLGNNVSMKGEALNTDGLNTSFKPLVDGSSVSRSGRCSMGSLIPRLVRGKVVLCFSTSGGESSLSAAVAVYQAGGAGLIFSEVPTRIIPEVSFIPIVFIDLEQGTKILSYYLSSRSPVVQLNPSKTVLKNVPAPMVVEYVLSTLSNVFLPINGQHGSYRVSAFCISDMSVRGRPPPSNFFPLIKPSQPDITAPGVNILAAWPPIVPPSKVSLDKRVANFNFLSGTSMSCPHISGIVALLKSVHPKWSPAAIKSAIMTTAFVTDTSFDNIRAGGTGKPADPFDFGSGHANPLQAMKPGLVYDAGPADYVLFLCSLGYTQKDIKIIVSASDINTTCPENIPSMSNLNYPSITISDLKYTTTIKRTVTNVGAAMSVYIPKVSCPPGVKVIVKPKALDFTPYVKSLTYSLTLKPLKHSEGFYNFGSIIWSNGYHNVRSSIAVRVNNNVPNDNEYVKFKEISNS